MVSFVLKNTLSDNGGVTRGVCTVDQNNHLCDNRCRHIILKKVIIVHLLKKKIKLFNLILGTGINEYVGSTTRNI